MQKKELTSRVFSVVTELLNDHTVVDVAMQWPTLCIIALFLSVGGSWITGSPSYLPSLGLLLGRFVITKRRLTNIQRQADGSFTAEATITARCRLCKNNNK
jgi:hypothetical protein